MNKSVTVITIASLFSLASPLARAQVFAPTAAERLEQAPAPSLVAQSPQAQPSTGDGKSSDDWRFAATLYGWAINLSGSMTARGNTVDVNASIFAEEQLADRVHGRF